MIGTLAKPNYSATRMPLPIRLIQSGSALLVTLVLLVVVTVIGIAGMSSTVLQERMAGNSQDNTQMFEVTEGALRRCIERVLAGDTTAVGNAEADALAAFNQGEQVASATAEFFSPEGFGNDLSAQGDSSYQMACLIEYNGPFDASRVGDSLRRPQPAGNLVTYNVMASGARLTPDAGAARSRPTVLLESRVILRR